MNPHSTPNSDSLKCVSCKRFFRVLIKLQAFAIPILNENQGSGTQPWFPGHQLVFAFPAWLRILYRRQTFTIVRTAKANTS